MNIRMSRSALFAVLFAATAAAAIAGAAVRGESRETPFAADCASAFWPMIPADCLDGGNGVAVRVIDADLQAGEAEADAEEDDLKFRFEAAFAG
jgi:hypothetical protein